MSLGGDPDASIFRHGYHKRMEEFALFYGHNIDFIDDTQEKLENNDNLFTALGLSQEAFCCEQTIDPVFLRKKKEYKCIPTKFKDIQWIKTTPNTLVKYNFEKISNIKSMHEEIFKKNVTKILVEAKDRLKKQKETLTEDLKVRIVQGFVYIFVVCVCFDV